MESVKDSVLNYIKMSGITMCGEREIAMHAGIDNDNQCQICDALESLVAEGKIFKSGDNKYSESSPFLEKKSDDGVDAEIYAAKTKAIYYLVYSIVAESIEVESASFVLDKLVSKGVNGIELCHVVAVLRDLNAKGCTLKLRGNDDGTGGYVFRG